MSSATVRRHLAARDVAFALQQPRAAVQEAVCDGVAARRCRVRAPLHRAVHATADLAGRMNLAARNERALSMEMRAIHG